MRYTKSFAKISKESVSEAGGKGASLGEMTQAGIPVPPGFVVLSGAFEEFLKVTDLNVELDATLDNVDHTVTHQVDDASEKIKALILGKEMPKAIVKEVQASFRKLGAKYVAVRSSATSEDSKDAAWAGQLESYLNTTQDSLLENVKKCWASLFTPRAIFYRFEKGLHSKPISVAVVVQKMIQSEVSGIAFSVHPVTQDYDQLIIEAGFGLGEAIVSGAITPDSYVVEKSVKKILDKNIAVQGRGLFRKGKIKPSEETNEWRNLTVEEGEKPSLSDSEVLELADLVVKIEKHYGFPVDVEWARETGKFYVVQSRPITTLSEKKEKVSPTFFDGHDWFLTVTRNMSFWHQFLSNAGHFHHLKDFGINANLQFLSITEGYNRTSAFLYQPHYGQFAEAVMKAVKGKKEIQQLKQKYQKHAKNLLQSLGDASKDLNAKTFQKFLDEYRRFCAGLMPMATVGRTGGELLAEKLKATSIPEAKIPETIAAITYPDEHTPLFNSQLDLLKIAEQIQAKELGGEQKKTALQKWLSDYGHIPVNFSDEPWTMKDAEVQLKNLITKDAKQELKLAKQSHVKRIARKKEILEDLKNKEITILALAVAEGTYINEFRKNVFCRVSLEYRDIFAKIAKVAGSKQWRDCFYLTPNEMTDILNGKKVDIKRLVKERSIVGAYVDEKGESKLLDPAVTRRFHKVIQGSHKAGDNADPSQAVKGFSANGGKVKGIVRVILGSKDFHKLNPGDILVTTMTSVDFVPIMERAAAFVTNEGGITSHASIVAREMNKPCIIGTKNATQVLKDGDEVEVNADAGVVQIIQRASI